MQSHDSCGGRAMAFGTEAAAGFSYCWVFFLPFSLPSDMSLRKRFEFLQGNWALVALNQFGALSLALSLSSLVDRERVGRKLYSCLLATQ